MSDFVRVASLDELADGEVITARVNGTSVVVTRVGDTVYALDNICSHDESPFDGGVVEGFELCCPRHEGRFDVRTGKATRWPAVWPINAYPVEVRGNDVYVGSRPRS
ncbi:MAG: non-heme iron oxygenase ferredoxin subunit [Dehalococcoidia bacterium]|nr:non-heme iron oxygenase ferredoxin subunit [Dehalococcoidia bacterium]